MKQACYGMKIFGILDHLQAQITDYLLYSSVESINVQSIVHYYHSGFIFPPYSEESRRQNKV